MGVPLDELDGRTKERIGESMRRVSSILKESRVEIVMLLECVYDSRVPEHCTVKNSEGEYLAAGTVLYYLASVLTCSPAEFVEPLEALRKCGTSRLALARFLHMHCIKELETGMKGMAPSNSSSGSDDDARSVQVVYVPARKEWVTAECLPTNRRYLQEVAATVRDGSRQLGTISELLSFIQTCRGGSGDTGRVSEGGGLDDSAGGTVARADGGLFDAYERLAFLLQLSASRLQRCRGVMDALMHQIALSSILHAHGEHPSALVSAGVKARIVQTALDGGDMTMMALLDIADVDLTHKERIAVANLFARQECKSNLGHFKTAVEREPDLGDRASEELRSVGLL